MIELCREGAAESEGNNGGLADQRGSHLNSERSNRNDEAPADLVEAAPAPAPRSLQTITFPPELLLIADEPAEVIVKCVCGCVLDRDVAAARVILKRAVVGPWAHNVAVCGERVPGNLKEISN